METVIIRTDASPQIGTGHVMRCLALAQGLKAEGSTSVFVLSIDTPLVDRLRSENLDVELIDAERGTSADSAETLRIASARDAQWIVLDGYAFDAEYQSAIRASGSKLLVIDDYSHLQSYDCDLLLNQNIDALEGLYEGKTDASLLLGPRFALLREEFLSVPQEQKKIADVASNILVTLGGANFDNTTGKVLSALNHIDTHALSIQVIVGAENDQLRALEAIADGSSNEISFAENVTDMPRRMQWADMAVAAAGSTSWELLCMGVPFITGVLAENQEGIANALHAQNLAVNVGWYRDCSNESLSSVITELIHDCDKRKKLSVLGTETIDHQGVQRIIEFLQKA